ncbi:MAG: L,D-transpeptidase family protein [Armatimonadetes bacterium]|nr:L,D-transpeptidase family protein [Armatimonadota bacterium]
MRTRWLFVLVVVAGSLVGWPKPALAQEEVRRALSRLAPVFGKSALYSRKGKEDIYTIARRYGVSASDLYNANDGDLLLGDELLLIPMQRIAPVPSVDGLVVNLAERGLYFYTNGRASRRFPVAVGMQGWETPTGDYTIANKAKNPTWFPPEWAAEEHPVPPGPDNPLGDRWMGLSIKGYGIHATNAPASIGRYSSHGCMRMYPEHAHALFELVKVGTPAKIVYEQLAIGYQPEEGILYLAHYPDPYRMGGVTRDWVASRLKPYGLAWVARLPAVGEALERPRGVPMPVLGSSKRVSVNGRQVEFAIGPTWVGADWLVPAGPLVSALGAEMEVGPGGNYVVIVREPHRLFFSPGDAEVLVDGQLVTAGAAPQMAAGHPLVPLKTTATGLGCSVGRDDWSDAVLVWDGSGPGRTGVVVGRPPAGAPSSGPYR